MSYATFNPRQRRVIDALVAAPAGLRRDVIDRVAGCSNGPAVIQCLRAKLGQDAIDMHLIEVTDRDGKTARPGMYSMTAEGRARLAQWEAGRHG